MVIHLTIEFMISDTCFGFYGTGWRTSTWTTSANIEHLSRYPCLFPTKTNVYRHGKQRKELMMEDWIIQVPKSHACTTPTIFLFYCPLRCLCVSSVDCRCTIEREILRGHPRTWTRECIRHLISVIIIWFAHPHEANPTSLEEFLYSVEKNK